MKKFWKNPYVLIGLSILVSFMVYGSSLLIESYYHPLPILGPQEKNESGKTEYHTIPEFQLVNQDGDTVSEKHFLGKITVVDFFFTHCPSICPKMTTHMRELQARFDEDEIGLASFSVDPVRDTAARLKEYAENYNVNHENWTFLTGDKKLIYLLARNGYFISASEGTGGPDDFIHSDLFTLVDPQGRIRGYYRGTKDESIEKLIKDIKKLQAEL